MLDSSIDPALIGLRPRCDIIAPIPMFSAIISQSAVGTFCWFQLAFRSPLSIRAGKLLLRLQLALHVRTGYWHDSTRVSRFFDSAVRFAFALESANVDPPLQCRQSALGVGSGVPDAPPPIEQSECRPIQAIVVEIRIQPAPVLSPVDCIRNTSSCPSVLDQIVADHTQEQREEVSWSCAW